MITLLLPLLTLIHMPMPMLTPMLMLMPMPMPRPKHTHTHMHMHTHMHTPCYLEEVQQELMRWHSMALLLPQLPLAPHTSRARLWPH